LKTLHTFLGVEVLKLRMVNIPSDDVDEVPGLRVLREVGSVDFTKVLYCNLSDETMGYVAVQCI
jgi:hypothetical protein